MRKLFAGALAALLCIGVFGTAYAEDVAAIIWKRVPVVFRTLNASYENGGARDSVSVTIGGLAAIDTSAAIDLHDIANASVDSLQLIRIGFTSANTLASGESLYITLDGSHDGVAFTDLGLATCGTCMAGGYMAAGAFTGQVRATSKLFNGAGSATAGLGLASGAAPGGPGRDLRYGNFGGFPVIRLRLKQDSAVVPVVNTVRIWLWYQAHAVPK